MHEDRIYTVEEINCLIGFAKSHGKKVVVFATKDLCYFENFMGLADLVEGRFPGVVVIRLDGVISKNLKDRPRPNGVKCLPGDDIELLEGVDYFCCSLIKDLPKNCVTINFHHDAIDIAPPFIYDFYFMSSRLGESTLFELLSSGAIQEFVRPNSSATFIRFGYPRITSNIADLYGKQQITSDHIVMFFSVPYDEPYEQCLLYPENHKIVISKLKQLFKGKIYLKFHPSELIVKPEEVAAYWLGDDQVEILDSSNSSERNREIISSSKFLLTDVSGSVYTNSLIYRKPVIFYTPFEVGVQNRLFFDQHINHVGIDKNFILYRHSIGLTCHSHEELENTMQLLDMRYDFYVRNIEKMLFASLYNVDGLNEYFCRIFEAILRNIHIENSFRIFDGRIDGVAHPDYEERFERYLRYKVCPEAYFS